MRILGEAAPGDILDLGLEIERCDAEAVAFDGWVRLGDTPVLELRRCLGPMLPLEDFDAPEAVRRDFETLCGPSARPGRFRGVEELDLTLIDRVPGQRLRAAISVPAFAPFFADHFPRRPIFPGALLLHAQLQLALRLAAETVTPGQRLRLAKISDVKMRAFILPGQRVEMETTLRSVTDGAAELTLASSVDGKRVATGRVEIVPRGPA
jgi:3-hydroxymyristoyl/3-hydroxydecanoyl-(acyl carrier protein) dehydratase